MIQIDQELYITCIYTFMMYEKTFCGGRIAQHQLQ